MAAVEPTIAWLPLCFGPCLCEHAAVPISTSRLFVHGGKSSSNPSAKDIQNDVWIYDATTDAWSQIADDAAPSLCRHQAVLSSDGVTVFVIGGWTGHHRSADVYAFSISTWQWTGCRTSGFPTGAGLSSFTATPLAASEDGVDDILVCGREGGLRIQRKWGNVYLLRCGSDRRCAFSEYPAGMASRSGHTASGLAATKEVLIIGGRDDKFVERVVGLKPRPGADASGVFDDVFADKLKTASSRSSIPHKDPKPRQRHAAVAIGDFVLLHGGETYDGRSKTPVNDVFVFGPGVVSAKADGDGVSTSKKKCPFGVYRWVRIRSDDAPNLASHSMAVLGGRVLVFGGFGQKLALGNCYRLKFS